MKPETKNHLMWIALLWVVFTAIGEWVVQIAIDNWPAITSNEGLITGDAIFFLFRATVPIFTLVVLILLYTAVRFSVPQSDERPAEAQYGSGKLFIASWIALSVVLNVLFIIYPGIAGLALLWGGDQRAEASNPLVVEVTAKQWEWDYYYPAYKISTINKLAVPVGQPVKFILKSDDVMHSFWVPAWGIKKAVIPGETRLLYITPSVAVSTSTDPQMRVQCAQICGIGHPLMRSEVQSLHKDDFAAWVKKQQAMGKESTMAPMKMGGKDAGGNMKGMNMTAPDATAPANGAGMNGMDMKSQNANGGTGGMNMNSGNATPGQPAPEPTAPTQTAPTQTAPMKMNMQPGTAPAPAN